MSNSGESKAARREHAREQARQLREKEQKRQKRTKWIVQGSVVLTVVVIAAVIVGAIFVSNQPSGPGPQNMASDGILLQGDGSAITAVKTGNVAGGAEPVVTDLADYPDTVNIDIYVDYQCPFCAQFETANADQLKQWVTAGDATLEIHPIAFLDSASQGNKYSTRAANAAACVANYEPDKFFDVNTTFFANQPAEQSSGLTDDEIKANVKAAGVDSAEVNSCIDDQTFADWTKAATNRVTSGTIPNSDTPAFTGTPMVIVNGTYWNANDLTDASEFKTFVEGIAADLPSTGDGTSTSTPRPTETPAG